MRLPSSAVSATIAALLLTGAALGPPAAAAPGAPSAGPTLAKEDTMHTEVSEVLVRAPRVTLDEILDRVARGEAMRDSSLQDQSYLVTVRVVGHTGGSGAPQLIMENVSRVYQKRPGRSRTVPLRHWEKKPPKKKGDDLDVNVEFGDDMREDIVNFAFQPAARRQFKYRIEGRELLGDHLIYRIAFEPRSALELYEPSGEVWVDTRDFVIVRQEIEFRQSPVPVLLRGIRRMVVERMPVGDTWVLSRVLARFEMTVPLPQIGRSFDFGIQCSDYALNTGLPDSLFATAGRRGGGAAGAR